MAGVYTVYGLISLLVPYHPQLWHYASQLLCARYCLVPAHGQFRPIFRLRLPFML